MFSGSVRISRASESLLCRLLTMISASREASKFHVLARARVVRLRGAAQYAQALGAVEHGTHHC
ncbi:hypothetical protein [Streptomyces sp. A30]|uniref:hypothetical protein n=1 Tax=Streptomyces sp. A30 TaxID=2789273 RepID=UPI0039811BFA